MPGTVIGITPNPGYAGQYSRNRYPIIESKQANAGTTYNTTTYPNNINFGDVVVLLCDSTGGTYVDGAVFINNGGTFPSTALTALTSAPTSLFAGFANREVKQYETYNVNSGSANTTLGFYGPGQEADVIVQGVATVGNYYAKSGNPAPVAGGPVFYRISTNGAGTFVGAIETASDSTHTVQLPNAFWTTGVVDTVNGTIEVTLVNPNIP